MSQSGKQLKLPSFDGIYLKPASAPAGHQEFGDGLLSVPSWPISWAWSYLHGFYLKHFAACLDISKPASN
uniref:Uncharacterized protein n=1 Tax=Anguilla anguilla TaxID=7936 RepID=A0A0E9XH22_ANGAN